MASRRRRRARTARERRDTCGRSKAPAQTVAVVDVRGVPRRAGRHATCDHARALDRPQRGARLSDRWRRRRADRRELREDARRGAPRPRGRGAHALVRSHLHAWRVSRTEELVALAEEAAAFGAPLVPHVRNEGDGVLEAVGEMVEVARRSGAPLHLSHLKVVGDAEPVEPLLELLDERADDRHHVSTSTPTAPAARCSQHAAGLGTGGRRGRDARARWRNRDERRARSRGRSRAGCPAGRTCSARSGRHEIVNVDGRDVGGRWRTSAAARPGRDGRST